MSPVSKFALSLGDGLQWLGLAALLLYLVPVLILISPKRTEPVGLFLRSLINGVTSQILTIAGWLVFLTAFVQLVTVLCRYVFGLAFTWLSEIVVYAFAASFMLAAAGALATGAHVRVDILRSRMSARIRSIIELAGIYLLLLPMMVLIINTFAGTLASSWRILEGSQETDGLPIKYLFKTLVPVFATLFLAQGLSEAIKAAMILRGLESEDISATHGAVA